MSTEENTQIFKDNKLLASGRKALAKFAEAGTPILYCIEEDIFYIYSNGYWKKTFEIELIAKFVEFVPILNKYSPGVIKQAIEHSKRLCFSRLDKFNKSNLLNFNNYMLDVETGCSGKHEPMYYSTIRIPYDYDPTSNCQLWERTLLEIFENDPEKVKMLQEFFGYCLTKETNKEKAMLLCGDSRTGKSTILWVLRNLVGDKNCASVPLKFISNPQYTPMLIGKLVNIDTDVSNKASEFEADFKVITSGEPVSVNQKYVETFEFSPFCKLALAANEFPRITDHSSAFYKRLILLPCDRVFEESEQNRNLKKQLLDELPGILNWALSGLRRLNERGRFEQKDFMADAIAELREESNPVEVFFKDNVEVNVKDDIYTEKSALYKAYCAWCIENGHAKMSSVRFSQNVFRKYSKVTFKDTKNLENRRAWKNLVIVKHVPQHRNEGWQE